MTNPEKRDIKIHTPIINTFSEFKNRCYTDIAELFSAFKDICKLNETDDIDPQELYLQSYAMQKQMKLLYSTWKRSYITAIPIWYDDLAGIFKIISLICPPVDIANTKKYYTHIINNNAEFIVEYVKNDHFSYIEISCNVNQKNNKKGSPIIESIFISYSNTLNVYSIKMYYSKINDETTYMKDILVRPDLAYLPETESEIDIYNMLCDYLLEFTWILMYTITGSVITGHDLYSTRIISPTKQIISIVDKPHKRISLIDKIIMYDKSRLWRKRFNEFFTQSNSSN